MNYLNRIVRYPSIYTAISVLLVVLVMSLVAWQVSRVLNDDRELPLIKALGSYAATLDNGTINSRAMGAAMLFGLGNNDAKQLVLGKLPRDAHEVVSSLDTLRTMYLFDTALLVNKQGIISAYSSFNNKSGTGKDISFRPYVKRALEGTPNVYPAVGVTSDDRGIYLAAPVRKTEDNKSEVIGVVAVKIGVNKLDALLKSWTDGIAMLVSPQGVVFAASREDWLFRILGGGSSDQIAEIKRSKQFANIFDKPQPPPLPFTLDSTTIDIEGGRYAILSVPLEWSDPAGDWMLTFLDKRVPWWTEKSALGGVAGAGLITALLLFWLYSVVRNAALKLKSQQELQAAHFIVHSSIQYASRIQRAILPSPRRLSAVVPDHFVIWEPRDVVGGDIYWCKAWGEGSLIILGDCTGHGVPGAFMTLLSTGALEKAMGNVFPGDVAGLLQYMHQYLQKTLHQDSDYGFSNDGIELGVCYLNAEKLKIDFAGARFDLYVLENGEVNLIKGDKSGLGYRDIPLDQQFKQREVLINKDKSFYLVSDGVVDQIGADTGWGVGRKRLIKWIIEMGDLPFSEQKDRLIDNFSKYQGIEKRRDDVSVVGFKV